MGGLFGVISKDDCVNDLYYGTDYHSHLGTSRGGMAVYDGKSFNRSIHSIENSYFRTKFEGDLKKFKGGSGIGIISDYESQPVVIRSNLGQYALSSVNKIHNLEELTSEYLKKGKHFLEMSGSGVNPTEMISALLNEGETFADGIRNVQDRIQGACSMLILTQKGIIAVRDKLGRTPLVIGRKDFNHAIASETSSFLNLGYNVIKYLGPGEAVLVTPFGWEEILPPREKMQVCSFLWVYYGFPASNYEAINVEETRYRCGRALANKDIVEVDFVDGVPDSGVAHAIGYSNQKKIPYKRSYTKYTPTWPRSFMPQNQENRELVAKMKLMPIGDIIEGKRIALCDDSIVRGTQLKNNSGLLFKYGAKEVHLRLACPPLIFPCNYLNFSRSRSTLDLIGRRVIKKLEGREDVYLEQYCNPTTDKYHAMVEEIGRQMGCTSLKYQELGDLIQSIGLPKCKLCTHCWDGSSCF